MDVKSALDANFSRLFESLDSYFGQNGYFVREDHGLRIDVKAGNNSYTQTFNKIQEYRHKVWPKVGQGLFDKVYFDVTDED